MVFEIISMFRTAVDYSPTCQALKAWFKLSRVRVTEGKTIVDV